MRVLYWHIVKLLLLLCFLFLFNACSAVEEVELPPTTAEATASAAPEPTIEPTSQPMVESSTDSTRIPAEKYDELEMVTLLPRDAIPAIDNPQFLEAAEADRYYDPDELVIGVVFDGEARAYSVPFLSNHEIVNDTVGGVKIAITW